MGISDRRSPVTMKTLYLRIYITVVAVLALFALAAGWLMQRHLEMERGRAESFIAERMAAWGELIQRQLPGVDAPQPEQAGALQEWSQRLRMPMALDDAAGQRIAASDSFVRRQSDPRFAGRAHSIHLEDGRTLWILRPGPVARFGPRYDLRDAGPRPPGAPEGPPPGEHLAPLPLAFLPPQLQGVGVALVLVALFVAVAAGAYPVVRRLTRRLEALKRGVEQFGAGALSQRVDASGRDEVAAVAASFNQAADRVQALLRSHQSLLANASHELRSPLARLKMAALLMADAPAEQRERLRHEIDTNIAELDALVEEVLLASRLDAQPRVRDDAVDLLPLAVEEAARVGATVEGEDTAATVPVRGDERLLRRALRNLLENARRYGGDEVSVSLASGGAGAEIKVCDRGPGVPVDQRERIFEPFYRMPGHAEQVGGVGLGLSLVKQIAQRHGGNARCEARQGGGSCFVISLPGA
jgi:signal transduction histidine kinase